MTNKEQALVAEVMATMQKNRAAIVAALATVKVEEYVHMFPKYNMGIKIDDDGKVSITGCAHVTITNMKDKRVFHNKAGNSTVLQHRRHALEVALQSMDRSIAQLPAILGGGTDV